MFKRRTLLMGGSALAAVAAVLPLAAATEGTASIADDWWPEWAAKIDAMPLDELSKHYEKMVRNCSPSQIAQCQQAGPFSQEKFYRQRQYVYRRMIAHRHGIVLAQSPDGLMHHPV